MRIVGIKAYPTSFPVPGGGPRLGIGQAVKRDAVVVKVVTEDGMVGWGESHHGRAHTAAVKLRIGDTVRDDIARMEAVRSAFGEELDILADANTAYRLEDARRVMPAMDALNMGWLEEPFPPHDRRAYAQARGYGRTPLAAGENHFPPFGF